MRGALLSMVLIAIGVVVPVAAQAVAQSYHVNIARQPLDAALKDLAQQTGLQIARFADTPGGEATVGPLNGDMSIAEALNSLLTPNKLTYKLVNEHTIAVSAVALRSETISSAGAASPADQARSAPLDDGNTKEGKPEASGTFRLAQADPGKVASPAAIDQSARSAANRDAGQLQEVIVTARKREESVLDVPVIEVAVTQAQLEAVQAVEITDLPDLVPGLQFGHAILSVGTLASIRGVGSTSLDSGVDSSVALNIDGLSPGAGLAFQSGLFDVGEVEVLKGPQALFFGKSTTGGVISLRTADPTDQLDVIARTSYEFESITPREEAIFSGPLTDTLKARLAAMYSSTQGYFKNTAIADTATGAVTPTDPRSPRGYNYIIRETTLWDPTEQFGARLKLNLVRDYAVDPAVDEISDCPEGRNFAPFGVPFIGNDPCQINGNYRTVWMNPAAFPGIINNGVPFNDTQQEFATLELNYRPIQNVTVTSVTADYLIKSTGLLGSIPTTDAATPLASQNVFHRRELTEEVRVSSDYNSPLNFTAGGFYEDGLLSQNVVLLGNTTFKLPPILSSYMVPLTVKTYSVFGQVRWQIVPRLELATGLRWSDETRTEYPINGISLGSPLADGAPIPLLQPRVHNINDSPEFTLTYKPLDDITLFAAWKEGFKSGSLSLATPPQPGTNTAFGEETARGGEFGIKSLLLDRHLTLNLAAYLYNYSGLQVGAVQPALDGQIINRTVNAGAARTEGVDFDTAFRPAQIEGLGVNAALDWNHARYLNLNNVPCWGGQTIAAGCNEVLSVAPGQTTGLYTAQNLSGTPMIRAPEWQANLGFNYEFTLARGYKLTLGNNNAFSSRYVTFLAVGRPNHDNYQGSFIKSDVGLSLDAPDNRWQISVIGKDLSDKITSGLCASSNIANGVILGGQITGGTGVGPAGVDQVGCNVDPGREVWLRLTVRPFASE